MVTEGIEDALAIKQKTNFGGAIWATCGTTFMQSLYIPHAAKFIIIAADFDKAVSKQPQNSLNARKLLGYTDGLYFRQKILATGMIYCWREREKLSRIGCELSNEGYS